MKCSRCDSVAKDRSGGEQLCWQCDPDVPEHIKKYKPGGSEFGKERKSYSGERKNGKKSKD